MERESTSTTRRAILSTIGGLAIGGIASGRGRAQGRTESEYALVQGGECVTITPIRGDLPVEAFYDYQLPAKYASDANGATAGDTAPYASAGTRDLQRTATTTIFLYHGPEGLSLVVLHGNVRNSEGGAVTFRISGLPTDGKWIVKDDLYREPDTGELASTNYDRWRLDGAEHRIDWTWGSSGTDGGVFRDLGDDFEVVVRPAFNEASPLYEEHYEGRITDWEFLVGPDGTDDRVSLDLSEPIRIETGACKRSSDAGATRETEQGANQDEQDETGQESETEDDRETEHEKETEDERETEDDTEDERETEQESETEEERETDHEHETERETEQEEEDDETEVERETERETDHEGEQEDEESEEAEEDEEGRGKGHEKGNGEGHEKGNGKGHDKHGDDDDEDDEDEDDD